MADFASRYSKIFQRKDCNIFDDDFAIKSVCSAGFRRLFITSPGDLYYCTSIKSSYGNIGNINDGFNEKNITKINQKYISFKMENCSKCWAARLCSTCQAVFDLDADKETIKMRCNNVRQAIKKRLKEFLYIEKNYPELLNLLKPEKELDA